MLSFLVIAVIKRKYHKKQCGTGDGDGGAQSDYNIEKLCDPQ